MAYFAQEVPLTVRLAIPEKLNTDGLKYALPVPNFA